MRTDRARFTTGPGLGRPRRLLGPARLAIRSSAVQLNLDRLSMVWQREPGTPSFERPTVPPPDGERGEVDVLLDVIIDESPSEEAVDPNGYRHVAGRRILELLRTELRHRGDRFAVVHFSSFAQPVLGPTSPHTKAGRQRLRQFLRPVGGGGGTDIVAGLRAAANLLPVGWPGEVVIILLTDGEDSHSAAELANAVAAVPPGAVHVISVASPLPAVWDAVPLGGHTVIPSMARPDEVEWITARALYQALGLGWSGPNEPPGGS